MRAVVDPAFSLSTYSPLLMDVVLLLQSWIFLASAAQKMIPPPNIWVAPFWRLTYGLTKLERTKGFVNLVNINDSSFSDRTMSIQRP